MYRKRGIPEVPNKLDEVQIDNQSTQIEIMITEDIEDKNNGGSRTQ
ncbi:unnamed protein product [Linum tenue]|uniref:Uncharacterized protein n=1 Tax=Linum tenue TaxID=586396 RepID=A0AAV0QMB8_9ROSI|nr:unnamed protein product [Linum tenue]